MTLGYWHWLKAKPKSPEPKLSQRSPPVDLKTILIATFVLFTASAWAQMAPEPGPEAKKLDYLVGTWTVEGMIGQGPWGAGGIFSSTDTTEWMPGHCFIEGHSDFKMPAEVGGGGKATSTMGYDTAQNMYTPEYVYL